eukprot:TRINITY_DN15158_c0_g1_i1.p1 TRINITY_DN15158_c0_g1~~TRINITY_DN15158_c0_g1_i1.p1  ORF type:complete len:677 (+),score=140.80 TRINITY_DN15158_c0_g1_i1:213-2033(+)
MEKPNWQEKYCNPEIWEKWRVEIEEQLAPKNPEDQLRWLHTGRIPTLDDGDEISAPGWEYLKKLLEWQASRVDGPVAPAAVEGAWIADNLVPKELKDRLLKAVAPFENVPDAEKDWHPGSDEQVLDLVHPSLFCLVYGVTRQLQDGLIAVPALKHMGGGEIVLSPAGLNPPERKRQRQYYDYDAPPKDYDTSAKYQWLPSEFDISPEGKVKISSYVNNIHPIKNKDMYFVLEEIFERFVPLFNKVLQDLARWDPQTFTSLGNEDYYPQVPAWDEELEEAPPGGVDLNEVDTEVADVMDHEEAEVAAELHAELAELADEMAQEPQVVPPEVELEAKPMDVDESGESESEEEQAAEENIPPQEEPSVEYEFFPPIPDDSIDIRGHRVQVIVKLANIILTPENSVYRGGSWHVEGMKNEAIVATGIYYYESQNITTSRLAFRKVIQDPSNGSYDDGTETARLNQVYGMDNMDPLNESRGSLITQEDRLICFPNILQHHVDPFELEDPTKPGYRKILVFFLIDPSKRIISTETVPPQQRHWYGEALTRHVPEIARLPKEMLENIISNVSECPMSLEEAKVHRQGLMDERKYFIDEYEQHVYERAISLCEH